MSLGPLIKQVLGDVPGGNIAPDLHATESNLGPRRWPV